MGEGGPDVGVSHLSKFDQRKLARVMEIANIRMEGGRLVAVGMLYGHVLFWNAYSLLSMSFERTSERCSARMSGAVVCMVCIAMRVRLQGDELGR